MMPYRQNSALTACLRLRERTPNPKSFFGRFCGVFADRYRIKKRLPGKPDLVFPSYETVIFIDGCFWHKCPGHFVQPKTRTQFWQDKTSSNVARDLKNNEVLKSQSWLVIRDWEHDIKKSLENTAANIVGALQKRKDCIHVKSY